MLTQQLLTLLFGLIDTPTLMHVQTGDWRFVSLCEPPRLQFSPVSTLAAPVDRKVRFWGFNSIRSPVDRRSCNHFVNLNAKQR
jgi:hypothetical protein